MKLQMVIKSYDKITFHQNSINKRKFFFMFLQNTCFQNVFLATFLPVKIMQSYKLFMFNSSLQKI